MNIAFISDLHLSAQDPAISNRFKEYISNELTDVKTLYILGDLFEYWIGDDAIDILGMREVINALKKITDNGVEGFFIAGNRDFLIGETFAKDTGFTILEDETVVDINGEQVLVLHGDSLCTDDIAHMQFRKEMMCNKAFHQQALAMPIQERIDLAVKMRGMSAEHKSEVSNEIMDVNSNSVVALLEKHGVQRMIHGHTHRPNIHSHLTKNGTAQRIVLGDWYEQFSHLKINGSHYELSNLESS